MSDNTQSEMEGLLGTLRHANLEAVEKILKNSASGYSDRDLANLAAHAGAIASVRDAIELYVQWGFKSPDVKALVS